MSVGFYNSSDVPGAQQYRSHISFNGQCGSITHEMVAKFRVFIWNVSFGTSLIKCHLCMPGARHALNNYIMTGK